MKLSMKIVSCLLISSAMAAAPANALTFKKGQVLSADGEVHDGASPEQQAALVEQSKQDGWFGKKKSSGVQGSNLYIVIEDGVVFVPIDELKGKSKDQVTEVIKGHIVQHLTADITKYNTDIDGSLDMEGLERDLQNVDNEITQQIADDIADVAVSAEAAAALTEATAAIATVDVNDAAAVAAAEANFEAAFEAAHEEKCAGGPGSADGC